MVLIVFVNDREYVLYPNWRSYHDPKTFSTWKMGLNYSADCYVQIGDLPEAEMKPPENVLFVCKLNPVTEVSILLAPGGFPIAVMAHSFVLHNV